MCNEAKRFQTNPRLVLGEHHKERWKTKMCSLAIDFGFQYKTTSLLQLDPLSLLAIFMVVAIIVVTRRYRRVLKPLNDERFNEDSSCSYRKPVPVENEDDNYNVSVFY